MTPRARWWLAPLCLIAVSLAAPSARASVSPAGCDNRVNDSPQKLVECINTNDLWTHMQALEAIAIANPGADGHPSRNSGEPGYKASVDYVAKLMKQAGYNVSIQEYPFEYTAYNGEPAWSESSPTARTFKPGVDWNPGSSNGTATGAQIKPAGGIVIPPTATSSSTSGCTSADFSSGGYAGKIALVQRGGCNYGVKVLNAKAAGAAGVVIFNEGNPTRTGLIAGSLVDANNNPFVPDIPVAFTTFAIGQSLLNEYNAGTPPVMSLSIHIIDEIRPDYNLIAESKGGDPNHVVVVDGHLDAIYGEGMLDNASGSVTILDIAQKMRKAHPLNKLRFIWFGGEELGELGSKYYVSHLSPSELAKIKYDLDADVMATPNYSIGILDPAAVDLFGRTVSKQFPANVYEPSKVARDIGVDYFNSIGKNHIFFSPVGTDAEQFQLAGVPASGLLTGQDCCKTQEEVDLFGGYLGNYEGNIPSFDNGCVDNPFRWCDNLSNNDPTVFTFMSKAFADMTARMADNTSVVWAGEDTGGKKPKKSAAAVARGQGSG